MTKNQLLIKFALRYRWLILASILFGFTSAIFNGVSVALIVPIILSVIDENMMKLKGMPPILSKPMSFFDNFSGETRIIIMLSTILILIILKNATSVINTIITGDFARKLANSIKKDILQLLMEVDLDFFQKAKIGTLISNLENESTRTSNSIQTFLQILTISFNVLIYTSILISISWKLTLLAFFFLFCLSLTNQIFIKRAKNLGLILRNISRIYNQRLIELFTGIRLIKSVSQEQEEYNELEKLLEKKEKAALDSQLNGVFIQPINEVGGIAIIILIVLVGRYLFLEQMQSIATVLLTYLIVLFRAIPLIGNINKSRASLANQSSSVEVTHACLNRKDKPFLVKGHEVYLGLKQGIKFDNVSFAYPGHDNLVIKNLNLFMPKDKITALVGSSGSGKSTLADLLARFYDPTEGKILIDEQDYRQFDLKIIRHSMGMVSQDTFLFNNTIRYNISYGLKSVTEEDLIDAAKRANAYEFILKLPKQFETEIGDRGVLLSGGQKQRLSIARALLRNPEILILDEATSALDTVSEKLVQEAIEQLYQNRTTLVIAHRLSTVQKADQIVVLDQGEIKEIGTHQELLAKNGYYAKLYNMQFTNHNNFNNKNEILAK